MRARNRYIAYAIAIVVLSGILVWARLQPPPHATLPQRVFDPVWAQDKPGWTRDDEMKYIHDWNGKMAQAYPRGSDVAALKSYLKDQGYTAAPFCRGQRPAGVKASCFNKQMLQDGSGLDFNAITVIEDGKGGIADVQTSDGHFGVMVDSAPQAAEKKE